MEIRASMRQDARGGWTATTGGLESVRVFAPSRADCLVRLRDELGLGPGDLLIVEVLPRLAGVAEAAAVMGWDKRRVVTYIDRGRFPEPLQALASGRIWIREELERFSEDWHARRAARLARLRSKAGEAAAEGDPSRAS